MRKIIFFHALMLLSANAFADISLNLLNNSNNNLMFEIRGKGSDFLPPNYNIMFYYNHPNQIFERLFWCKSVNNKFMCGDGNDQVQFLIHSGNCSLVKGNLNNHRIECY